MAISISTLPSSVYRKNLIAAYSLPRPAPDADQEVHRQQHHFPEHVEQEEVERQEDAEHARFQQQEQDAVGLHVLLDRPAGAHRQHADERGQQRPAES